MFSKENFEKYAILSLIRFYDPNLQSMLSTDKKHEKPDFQSGELGIGIEVTEAISEKQGEERFIINNYFGKGLDGETVKAESEKRFGNKIRGKISVQNGVAVYSKYDGMFDTSEYMDSISNSILRKMEKLNNHYEIFNENWLYVFTHTSLIEIADIEVVCWNWFSNSGLNFDKIFLNCMNNIYSVDSTGNIVVIKIDNSDLMLLLNDASPG